MKWKTFHIEHISAKRLFGIIFIIAFGHTVEGFPLLTLSVSRKTKAMFLQLGG